MPCEFKPAPGFGTTLNSTLKAHPDPNAADAGKSAVNQPFPPITRSYKESGKVIYEKIIK